MRLCGAPSISRAVNGSRTAPLQTISAGLAQLQGSSKRYVLVAQGLYRENVRLFEGAQLFGGYAPDFLKRDPQVHLTQLVGVQGVSAPLLEKRPPRTR